MSAIMTEPMASKSLAQELWISFASLLRSHVAMHSIAQPNGPLRVLSHSASALELLGPNGKMSIVAPTASSAGTIEFRPEAGEMGDDYSAFFFMEDGLLHLEALKEAMEMEAAVEHLLSKVRA